jgi:hypothetical protein
MDQALPGNVKNIENTWVPLGPTLNNSPLVIAKKLSPTDYRLMRSTYNFEKKRSNHVTRILLNCPIYYEPDHDAMTALRWTSALCGHGAITILNPRDVVERESQEVRYELYPTVEELKAMIKHSCIHSEDANKWDEWISKSYEPFLNQNIPKWSWLTMFSRLPQEDDVQAKLQRIMVKCASQMRRRYRSEREDRDEMIWVRKPGKRRGKMKVPAYRKEMNTDVPWSQEKPCIQEFLDLAVLFCDYYEEDGARIDEQLYHAENHRQDTATEIR